MSSHRRVDRTAALGYDGIQTHLIDDCGVPCPRARRTPTMQELHFDHLHYDRICRTSRSESYLISQGEEPIARVELHFAHSVVYGLLIIEKDASQQVTDREIEELRDRIDMDLVETADMPRDDFILTVYQGREIATYSDPDLLDEEEIVDEDESTPS
jgi:hypothetical protein